MVKTKPQSIPAKLLKTLADSKLAHKVINHRTVFTAYDVAATLKRKLEDVAKALIVMAGNFPVIVIMPAHARLDEKKISKILADNFGVKVKAKIPKEKVVQKILKDMARPVSAFGSLYKLPVIIDKGLITNHLIVFPAASFNNSVEMMVKDFIKLEKAVIAPFAQANKVKMKIQKPPKKAKKKMVAKKKKVIKKVKPKTKKRK
jgi:prolyl-tRNA editing enzyme YbaK/EbsC (Cys-tRNA(Pro) deacylase)